MRVLTICNRYPPDDAGGYPQLCFDVVQGVQARGHQVLVLTTAPQKSTSNEEPGILRVLEPDVEFGKGLPAFVQQLGLSRRERHNQECLLQAITSSDPDIILFWPSESMTKSLFTLAENNIKRPVAYYVAGYSPLEPGALQRYWLNQARSGWKRWPKQALRRGFERTGLIDLAQPVLQMRHVACVSRYEQQHAVATGVSASNTTVVNNGIDLAQFRFAGLPSTRRQPGVPLRLLYAGRLTWDKGAHVALQALGHLVHEHSLEAVRLVILGKGNPRYTETLHRMVSDHGLAPWISFVEWMPRSEIAPFLADFDTLVLPTIHDEPLARIVQEAMAIGLVVIGTPTGGTPEILIPEVTGLSFEPEDSRGLAGQIRRVHTDLGLCDTMTRSARSLVEERFTIDGTVRQMESLMLQWVEECKR
ncbi:MAG: glycosyltransferase family 4 protein [Anaerolineae bacterium]|nr:glycosyltransferase family 4 protein [Anaerolineae bacterium]